MQESAVPRYKGYAATPLREAERRALPQGMGPAGGRGGRGAPGTGYVVSESSARFVTRETSHTLIIIITAAVTK